MRHAIWGRDLQIHARKSAWKCFFDSCHIDSDSEGRRIMFDSDSSAIND
jgi:hypothetical protein